MDGLGTVRARLAFFLLEILWKIKPNEYYENLKFCENLKIWLEILSKIKPNEKYEKLKFGENLKIWLEILNKKNLKKNKRSSLCSICYLFLIFFCTVLS